MRNAAKLSGRCPTCRDRQRSTIRLMSRWGKDDLVRTDKDGFVIADKAALEELAAS
jgi:hypothetical protein